jgi:tetratricopeptide (TPR) repeat protein
LAYEQRARETGDPSYYSKAEGALRRALRLRPDDLAATAGLGSLALSRHRFRQALALGRGVVRLSPTTAVGYGIVGDALVELGRYRAAFAAFNRMAELKPGVASYSRIAYGRELLGDTAGAEQAWRLAVDAASSAGEPTAWTHWQLGKLYWSAGRAGAAEHEFRAALAAFPGYPYALDALALAEAASGDARKAIELERRAVDAIPLPQFVANLGDLYRAQGVYTYAGGWNWRAVVATIIGCALAWIGLKVTSLHILYDFAWFVGFGVAALSYWALMKAFRPQPALAEPATA